MFLGEYKHSVDQKGRVAVPAKFRAKLEGGAIITRGLDHCLFLFTQKEWDMLADKITKLPIVQGDSRAFSRLMFAGASDCDFDGQGRVLIPEHLRTFAGISKKIVLIGLYNRVELWDEDQWRVYQNKTENSSEEIAEKLTQLGI